MSIRNVKCNNCGVNLKIDDGNCYAGGIKDTEYIFCPNCGYELFPVYTSGVPEVFFDHDKKRDL